MKGSNITNKYILNSHEYYLNVLSKVQLDYIKSMADKVKYNHLRE